MSKGRFYVSFTGRTPEEVCPSLGVPIERFYRPHQIHGTEILVINEDADGTLSPAHVFDPLYCNGRNGEAVGIKEGVDAVIYNVRNACIGISTADCIPVMVYDPEHHCAAAIHAGWRGTVARIVVKTIEKMCETYGTRPSSLQCLIGPGISYESFEVGDEVYETFLHADLITYSDGTVIARQLPSTIKEEQEENKKRWHIDLKECNRQQLLSVGVPPGNITVSDIDTVTDSRCFSARRDGIKTGRMLSGVVLE